MTVISVFQVTVILKHVFAPAELEQEPTMKTDLEADMASECAKLGPVDKVFLPCHLNTCMSSCSAVQPLHKCHNSNNNIVLGASVSRHIHKNCAALQAWMCCRSGCASTILKGW